MKFKGEPNLYVRISNKYVQRATGKKGFVFDTEGFYETDNEVLIKLLSQNFEVVENNAPGEEIKFSCKNATLPQITEANLWLITKKNTRRRESKCYKD